MSSFSILKLGFDQKVPITVSVLSEITEETMLFVRMSTMLGRLKSLV